MSPNPPAANPTDIPDVTQKFTLGEFITDEQQRFLDIHGFVHFKGVCSKEEVETIIAALDKVQQQWLDEERKFVNGIPLFWGKDLEGKPWLQRFAFLSQFAPEVGEIVRDQRFEPIRKLIGDDARVGDDEKDGVVVNRYLNVPGSVYPRLGWHTDGLRDLFRFRMPQQMLNVGLHLDKCTKENGGLRILPGTHDQGFLSMLLKKPYFVSHGDDKNEVCVETDPGDLTIHDGRLWHRVAQSTFTGEQSLRRSMYVPYLTGPYEPKSDESSTPPYHHVGRAIRKAKQWVGPKA